MSKDYLEAPEFPGALCEQVDPELWFPERGGDTLAARRLCHTCPYEFECLEYALRHDIRFGIYGGTSARERQKIRRDRAKAAQAPALPDDSRGGPLPEQAKTAS
jgi:WhiB family redox-sensing transcriptional regulator